MQCLIPRADHDLFFHGEPSSEYMTYSFTCPLCGQLGFTETSFSRHVFQKHPGEEAGDPEVICPLCATHSEGGDHNRQTRHMARHLIATHHLTAPKEDENGILLVPYLQSYRNVRTTDPPSSHNSVAPQPSRSVYSIHPRYSTHRRLLPFVISRPPRSQESARNVCCLGTNRSRLTGTPLSHNLSPCETMCDILSTTGRPNRSIQNSFSSSLVCGAMATQQSSAVAIFSGRNSRNQDNEGKTVSLSTTSPHAACTVHTRINAAHTDALVDLSSPGWGAVVQSSAVQSLIKSSLPSATVATSTSGSVTESELNTTNIHFGPSSANAAVQEHGTLSRQSVSGDPFSSLPISEEGMLKDEKLSERYQPVVATTITKDEFGGRWAVFLSELVCASLHLALNRDSICGSS
ncbi:E3 ubiquitin-protein ligase kcmf1 [Clonorchis sinensis]|uniref:E3 ubiquitin-protein ligase kcmf1 n=1 Tax=Clonorchis sinensis TaxID=79923 RepID=A0A419PXH0_CLOSI|nr:E3 ubiquitin-protein ligase kcmf1 [Clonorchis sinensis]